MGTNGYKTKLNRNGMKVKNIHSNPKSFGMKMNKQKQSAMDSKNISQNLTSLPINVLRNKYNLQINTINLNKVKSISFGGIEDWKKWTDKNPLFKSLVDLQKYTALGTVTAALGKHLGLVSGSILTNCNATKKHFLHISQILDSEGFDTDFDDIDNFFENIDMDKLKKYHKVYESYMEEYIPKKMDINETYSIKLEKKDKRICIYDEIECEDVFYVKNLPIELLNTISEEVEEEEKEEAILNVISYSYTPLHLNTNSYSYNRYGLKNGDGMMLC